MVSPPFHLQDMPNLQNGYKNQHTRKEYNQQNKKETEDMLSKKSERSKNMAPGENNEKIFWNLFLETGRIDAYLLLKEEEAEQNKEPKT